MALDVKISHLGLVKKLARIFSFNQNIEVSLGFLTHPCIHVVICTVIKSAIIITVLYNN